MILAPFLGNMKILHSFSTSLNEDTVKQKLGCFEEFNDITCVLKKSILTAVLQLQLRVIKGDVNNRFGLWGILSAHPELFDHTRSFGWCGHADSELIDKDVNHLERIQSLASSSPLGR